MKGFKKVIRWSPIVTLAVLLVMLMGYHGYNDVNDWHYGDQSWVSNPSGWSMSDVKSQFGHSGIRHWLLNGVMLLIYGMPVELMLKKKWKYIVVLGSCIGSFVILENIFSWVSPEGSIGASGWLGMLPGIMFAAAMYAADKLDEDVFEKLGALFFPVMGFGLSLLMSWEDVKGFKAGVTAIGHAAHLTGAGAGMATAIVAASFYGIKWVKEEIGYRRRIREYKMGGVGY